MEYIIDIYEIDELNKYRFALGSISEKRFLFLVLILVLQMTKNLILQLEKLWVLLRKMDIQVL